MNLMPLVMTLAAGATVGWLAASLLARGRVNTARAQAAGAAGPLLESLNAQLRDETSRRAAAHERAEQLAERVPALERELRERIEQVAALRTTVGSLETGIARERQQLEEERALIATMRSELQTSFRALSAEALKRNNEDFLILAKSTFDKHQQVAASELDKRKEQITHLVKPLHDSLEKVDKQFREIEQTRLESYAQLLNQVGELKTRTGSLAQALRAPKTRGRWGELHLRRVAEMAGMLNYCDFNEQACAEGEDGRLQPDMVVRLAGGKSIVVDAKTPMDAYLEAMESEDDDVRRQKLVEHAARIRQHVKELSSKQYWKQFDDSVMMVVLFLPSDALYHAAMEHDPALLEFASNHNVGIATPSTLITQLRAFAYGWREQALAENARAISSLGRELYDRVSVIATKWAKLGRHLDGTISTYNDAVGSMETRFLPTARKLEQLDVASEKGIPELEPIEKVSRRLAAPEFAPALELDKPLRVLTASVAEAD